MMNSEHNDPPFDIGIEDLDFGGLSRDEKEPTTLCLATVGLEEMTPDGEGALHPIVTSEFTVGRHRECNLVLRDRMASRRHLRIFLDGDDFLVQDNDSSNGTYVNGVRITGIHKLRPDDVVLVGNHRFRFVRSEPGL